MIVRRLQRKMGLLFSCLLISQVFLAIIPINTASAAAPKTQKTTKIVETDPGGWNGIVGWYQEDDGMFKADFPDGTKPRVANGGTANQPYPVPYRKSFPFTNIASWAVASWNDVSSTQVNQIKNIKIKTAVWDTSTPDITAHGNPVIVNDKEVMVDVTTGGRIPEKSTNYSRFGTRPNGDPKYLAEYLVPLRLIWQGELYQEKEIDVNPDSSVQVGKTKQLNASVRTKDYGETAWGGWSGVASSSETTWISENTSIATVSNTGLVTAKAVGTVNIRATWKSGVYEISDIATITVTTGVPTDPCATNPTGPGCGPTDPPTYNITGDFDIVPNEIEYRESFAIKPKNFVISAPCTYVNHRYIIRRDGDYSLTNFETNRTQTTSYSYSTYPNIIGVGSHEVALKITAQCDGKTIETDWLAAKALVVNGPSSNSPPVFDAGFFYEPDVYSFDPIDYAAINSRLNLRIINDPRTNPPKPYDPDGDPIYYYWDFAASSSSWIRSFPTEYGTYTGDEQHRYLMATELGYHCIKVTARDPYGAASARSVCVNVVPENPIPVINGPTSVVEGRPLASSFDGSRSFSPIQGRTIQQFIWGNVKNVYTVPGTELITLEVIDSGGLRSRPEDKAVHTLTVKPDLPPVPDLEYVNIGIRKSAMHFKDTSYSPDGDQIVEHTIKLVCDANNNGSFVDDTRTTITANALGEFDMTPSTVGKCAIEIHLKEDWGKIADKQFIFSIVNLEPEADFSAVSVNPEPPAIHTIAPKMSEMMGAAWDSSSPQNAVAPKGYALNATANTLETRSLGYYEPYKGITTSNVVKTAHEISRSYCGTCGNTGTVSGPYWDFTLKNRVERRLWGANEYGYQYYYEDRSEWRSWPKEPVYSVLFNAYASGTYGSQQVVNLSTGYIWVRKGPSYYYVRSSHAYTDLIYRISDLKSSVQAGNSVVNVNPISTSTQTVYCPTGLYTCYPSEAPTPPQPSSFAMPEAFAESASLEILKTNTEGKQLPTEYINSNFIKDYSGNTYKGICTVTVTWGTINSCSLAKYNSSGQTIWQSATAASYPAIEYVSSDSSKLLVGRKSSSNSSSTTLNLLNNNNGSKILEFQRAIGGEYINTSYYGISMTNGVNYYLGVYNDVIAYLIQTAEPGFPNTLGKKASWELKFYNMSTGVTASAGTIKSYVGRTYNGSSYGEHYNYINAMPASVVSSDGKLMIANYYTNVLIYDMKTLEQEGDIPVGIQQYNGTWVVQDPANSTNDGPHCCGDGYDDDDSYNYIKSMNLTEDGRLKIVYGYYYRDTGQDDIGGARDDDEQRREVAVTIQTTPSSNPSISYGYISSLENVIVNGDLSLKVTFKKNTYSDMNTAGIGFRSQDYKNLYRAELSTSQVRLTKIVNGVPATIASFPYAIKQGVSYDLKVKARDAHIIVYVNGVPVIDKTDGTFASGSFGLYADVPFVEFKNFSAAVYEASGEDVENQAIVNMPITYNSTFTDPEEDPRIADKTTWVFTNVQPYKFLDAGDGASDAPGHNTYDNVKVKQPGPSLSKVGIYQVDFSETDDPAPTGYKYPNTAFGEFQKQSYPATHYIVVHRRPVAKFTLSINSTDHTVVWDDQSYDPDRWLSTSKYSTEATGINYQATRGVVDRKYYSIAPNGTSNDMKLIAPSVAGTYTVGLAVKDEYGAWSDWAEAEIEIAMPVIDEPPTPGFTLSKTTLYRGDVLTLASTAYDKEDGAAANLSHQYWIRNSTDGSAETLQSNSRGVWTKVFDSLGVMSIRQVVCDSKGQCAQIAKTVSVINRPPQADFDWTPKPAYEGDDITIVSKSVDPDKDDLAYAWTIAGPGGFAKTGTASQIVLYGGDTENRPGTYRITLIVRDEFGATDTVEREIVVHKLGIVGMVRHTEDWESNRIRFNEKYPDAARPSDWFWAGEAFVLSADVTDTGFSTTKPVGVEARAPHNLLKALAAEDVGFIRWQGMLRSSDAGFPLDKLPQGPITFTFSVTYSNGVVKASQVTITIRNTVDSFVQVHRVQ